MVRLLLRRGLVLAGLFGALTAAPGRAATAVYSDLVLDEARGRIYASGGNAGSGVDVLALSDLTALGNIPLAGAAAGLDLAPDGRELAVAVPAARELVFINLDATQTVTTVVPTDDGLPWGVVDVVYGPSDHLYASGAFEYYRPGSLHLIDTATAQDLAQGGMATSDVTRLAMAPDRSSLYMLEPAISKHDLYRFTETAATLVQTAHREVMAYGGLSVARQLCVLSDGRLATASGQIWPADLGAPAQTVPVSGTDLACAGDSVLFADGTTLRAVDWTSGQELWSFGLGAEIGPIRVNAAHDRVVVSTAEGLRAFGTDIQARVYLPELHAPRSGIYGRILLNGAPAAGRWVALQRWEGSGWFSILHAVADAQGDFVFAQPPTLLPEQRYRVQFSSPVADQVSTWTTAEIPAFQTGLSRDVGAFDIAGIQPLTPLDGAVVDVPQTFQWTTRDQYPAEFYAFDLKQMCCLYAEFYTGALGHSGMYTLAAVPPGFAATGAHDYRWEAVILDSLGGVGRMQSAFAVGFQPTLLPTLGHPGAGGSGDRHHVAPP